MGRSRGSQASELGARLGFEICESADLRIVDF